MVPPVLAHAAENRRPGERPAAPLTAAVVGTGAVAKQHLACLSDLAGARIGAVCDLSPAVGESVAARFGVPAAYVDHRALLADVRPDVVHVCTPPAAHERVAMDALAAGAHVIVEKPIVTDAANLEPLL